jgi:hypothetical protein
MEKTLQTQYNLIKEGKGDKAYFLKSAYRLFPDMLSQTNTFEDTTRILKNRGVISEGIGGLVTTGKKQDWHAIFNENMAALKEEKEAKAEEKETTKEVTDMATRGYDYKDEKNYDNVFGQEFLKGYYTEMKDPKNADKDVEELRAIVAKNLAKDTNHYVKDGQFGVKGLGYKTEAPGLGTPKEPKGKFKSSGYGDLKESVLRSQIHLLIKEALKEVQKDPKAYADEEEFETRVIAKLKNNDEAKKYFEKHSAEITKKHFNHNKPEGGVSDAVKYILSKAESNPIHEKKKPSAGLTQKEKSAVSKKAHAGKDIGKKGKGFEKVAKAAEKEYGSEEAGKKVAAAAMWKNLAKGKK